VRKICENCKKEYALEKNTFADLEKIFGTGQLLELFTSQKIKLKATEKGLESMTFYRGEGCAKCSKSGYKGRVGIYEVLEIDKELIKKINDRATAEDIREYAKEKKMITLLQDGLIKAKMGITTIEEILRATKE
jgi:type IV pilus assembly protein PilB